MWKIGRVICRGLLESDPVESTRSLGDGSHRSECRPESTSFIAVGMLHALGPDGIPRQLQSMGIDLQESAELA